MPIDATFGALDYQDEPNIVLPIAFTESGTALDVLPITTSGLSVQGVAGSDVSLLDYTVRAVVDNVGDIERDKYEVVFTPARNTAGAVVVDFTGEVEKQTDSMLETVTVTPILISYNNLTPILKDVEAPYQTDDGWWNIGLEFEYSVVGFGIHSIITGIEHTADHIYRALTLDVKPSEPPPAFSEAYPYADAQQFHCIGDWEYVDLASTTQARFFWVKLNAPDVEEMPEIYLREEDTQLKPVSVEV